MEEQRFDGETFKQDRDGARLTVQYQDVLNLMSDHQWWSLGAIEVKTGHPQASISARIRDMRKERFGSHRVERRYVMRGLYEYRLDGSEL